MHEKGWFIIQVFTVNLELKTKILLVPEKPVAHIQKKPEVNEVVRIHTPLFKHGEGVPIFKLRLKNLSFNYFTYNYYTR